MNIEQYKAQNGMSNDDIVEAVKPEFPKFGRSQLSMCAKGTYGVVLAPGAVKVLNALHPAPKPKRRKPNKLTVRLSDMEYAALLTACEDGSQTIQDFCERAIHKALIELRYF